MRELVVDEKRQSGERHFKASLYISGSKMRRTRYFLDGGKTNAIYYHAEIRDVADISTYVGDFYCEFYASFTGHFY